MAMEKGHNDITFETLNRDDFLESLNNAYPNIASGYFESDFV
jgi:hypothetical protein